MGLKEFFETYAMIAEEAKYLAPEVESIKNEIWGHSYSITRDQFPTVEIDWEDQIISVCYFVNGENAWIQIPWYAFLYNFSGNNWQARYANEQISLKEFRDRKISDEKALREAKSLVNRKAWYEELKKEFEG